MQIIGIVLVRNEERFIERAILNVAGFCDRILVADHESTDDTPAILAKVSSKLPHVTHQSISHPSESHEMLKSYTGTPTWIFGVDGDELYEPDRLARFRSMLEEGRFNDSWMILGNALHCDELDMKNERARGYVTPPCRSMTKFYNFNAITSWDGDCVERLHGGTPVFKPGFDASKRVNLFEQHHWDTSPFRCLHLCFLPRSRVDETATRRNIMETYGPEGSSSWTARLRRILKPGNRPGWKEERYRRGERVEIDCRGFFSNQE